MVRNCKTSISDESASNHGWHYSAVTKTLKVKDDEAEKNPFVRFVRFEANPLEDGTDRAAMHTLCSVGPTQGRNKRMYPDQEKTAGIEIPI
jgi:hypothetical protein